MTSLFGTWRICMHFRPLHDHVVVRPIEGVVEEKHPDEAG